MPTTTHEPSGLIAIRALVDMERERQDRERAEAAAREAAAAEARRQAEAIARAEAEEQARAAAELAERARRKEEQRRHEERLRAAEIEGRVRAAQAAHLARVQAELATRAESRTATGRIGLWTAASLGVLGLGLALLFNRGPAPIAPSPVLVPAAEDPVIRDARVAIADLRSGLQAIKEDAENDRKLLDKLLAEPVPVAAAPEPVAPARPKPVARPTARPSEKPTTKPGGIKICATNDPLAEDC